jgi:uncharacterized protein
MIEEIDIRLLPEEATNREIILQKIIEKEQFSKDEITDFRIIKKSIDARAFVPVMQLRIEVAVKEVFKNEPLISQNFKDVSACKSIIIVGAGPAGYFAALECLELGLKPIVLDRGKDVRARRRDLKAIQQYGEVNPHSNYCYGEGGAGTYSDGKLYTRSHKRGQIEKALRLLVEHGSNPDILIEAHPHIGSNKLPIVVANIRETIIQYGGEVRFGAFVTDFIIKKNEILGVIIDEKEELMANAVILATGHSARDIYYLLDKKKIAMEAKPFALGVRAEHSQSFIDEVQYRQKVRSELLPAASYSLVAQSDKRGVFSFCMCPGGLVVPAATAPGEIVMNGMSMSRRDSPFANSGVVVAVELEDIKEFHKYGALATLMFQKTVEQNLFAAGDGSQKAPAQKITDFINQKLSASLLPTSYIPGVYSARMDKLLPDFISNRLRDGFTQFGKMMKGYVTEDAQVIGTESRTSSPVRIPRDKETMMHIGVKGLFPCGEGAGYAGGIISAAMDGQNVAKAVAKYIGI